MSKSTDIFWYPLRVTYGRELLLKELLDSFQIENFIPMHYEEIVRQGRKIRKLAPVIHNLIFVRTSRQRIDEIKSLNEISLPIRYIIDREHQQPLIIPENQMRNFIAVSGNYKEQIIYLDPCVTSFNKGDRVRITSGIFEGVEGEFLRIKGDRRVVVSIQGVMAVATAFIHPSMVEPVNSSETK